jgi:thiamine-monophosphate kinase
VKSYDKVGKRPEFSIIGHITEMQEGTKIVTPQGTLLTLEAQGWNALS